MSSFLSVNVSKLVTKKEINNFPQGNFEIHRPSQKVPAYFKSALLGSGFLLFF